MAAGIKLGKMSSFELNPRGNIWFNDETTFGHKLLSKMGWSKGKGLGKNENGIQENIKILRKDNLTGVGFKNDTYISVGCVEYESILRKLQQRFNNEDHCRTENLESLEQRSRNSKSRLHYRKFIKSKDLFQRSEKDMKCIFLENPQDSCEDHIKKSIDDEIITVTSKLSMTDYFKQKMQQNQNISSTAEDATENLSFEKSWSNLSKKRKIVERSEIRKKIKLECEKGSNEFQNSPSKAEKQNLSNPKMMTSFENKDNKTEIRKAAKKKKFTNIKNLKSCIKLKSKGNLDKQRKVSFNDHVSYKILDNNTENVTDISFNSDYDKELDTELLNHSQFKSSTNNKEKSTSMNSNEIKETEEKKDQLETPDKLEHSEPECFDLPHQSASSYNCWLESQRTALKMKLYRNMIKKLKKHHVLCTTNLLDIKGYGNWGFKV